MDPERNGWFKNVNQQQETRSHITITNKSSKQSVAVENKVEQNIFLLYKLRRSFLGLMKAGKYAQIEEMQLRKDKHD